MQFNFKLIIFALMIILDKILKKGIRNCREENKIIYNMHLM